MKRLAILLLLIAGCGNEPLAPKFFLGCLPSCAVSCKNGHYACCYASEMSDSRSCYMCVCVKDNTTRDCDAGGPGAYSCSIPAEIAETWE